MGKTTNFDKHTTKNPIGRVFLNNFLNTVVKTTRPLNIDTILERIQKAKAVFTIEEHTIYG